MATFLLVDKSYFSYPKSSLNLLTLQIEKCNVKEKIVESLKKI